ncbi:DUF2721 domain-containing protein [Spirochaeta dissipatitropha]
MQDMTLSFSTPGLLFPAISLLFLSFTNRFISYASLVRGLHSQWLVNCDPAISSQINNLRKRMHLIKMTQIAGALSLLFCTVSMILIVIQMIILSWIMFAGALVCMAAALLVLIVEVGISMNAIELQLNDMQTIDKSEGCPDT